MPLFCIYPAFGTLEQIVRDLQLGITYIIFKRGDFTVITTEEYLVLHFYKSQYVDEINFILAQISRKFCNINLEKIRYLN